MKRYRSDLNRQQGGQVLLQQPDNTIFLHLFSL